MQDIYALIQKYYDAFNAGQMETMYSCLHSDFVHDINEGERKGGIEHFKKFMNHMNTCYKEELKDIAIMVHPSGTRAAAEFYVYGTYLQTDVGLPEAKMQKYVLKAGTFFDIKDRKISRVTTYYNLKEWIKQVTS